MKNIIYEDNNEMVEVNLKCKIPTQYILLGFIVFSIVSSRIFMYIQYGIETNEWNFIKFLYDINYWDANWYRSIVENGYIYGSVHVDSGQASWNFFPLNALMVRAIWSATGIDIFLVASVLNTILFGLAEWYACKYILLTRNSYKEAFWFVAFMSYGIYTFYFSIFYSEALYLLLFVLCLYYMKKEEYIKMGISGAFLSVTRSTGVFFVFCVLCYWIEKYLKDQNRKKTIKGFALTTLADYKLILGVMLVPLGLFIHMGNLKRITGDSLAFAHTQVAAWNREFKGFAVIEEGLQSFSRAYLLMFIVIGVLILCSGFFRKKNYFEIVLPLITVLLSGSQTLVGNPRYIIGSFIFVVYILDDLIQMPKRSQVICFIATLIFEMVLWHTWIVLGDSIMQ